MSEQSTLIQSVRRSVKVRSSRTHYEGNNDYSKYGETIDEIVDKAGLQLKPVWKNSWTNIANGLATRCGLNGQIVWIAKRACPVRIKWRHWSKYMSYTDAEHCSQREYYRWVSYEADAGAQLSLLERLRAWVQ
jgi:hypothetical protein